MKTPSLENLEEACRLLKQAETLKARAAALLNGGTAAPRAKRNYTMSPEARARLSATAKARWAKAKKAGKARL